MTIHKRYCAHCKRKSDIHIHVVRILKNGDKVFYYYCNPCNTKHCKEYRRTPQGKKNIADAVRRFERAHKRQREVWTIVNEAVRIGTLKKPKSCSRCHKKKQLHAHHDSYKKGDELKVRFLCRTCHKAVHRVK